MQKTNYDALTAEQKLLLDKAEAVMPKAYNPYSGFFVGAALLTEDGIIVEGANVENAAYGSTICAERAAILRANAMGYRRFKAVAIIGKGEKFEATDVVAPCGSCRQMLFELHQISGKDLETILSNTKKDKIVISTIIELLPLGFGPKDLGIDVSKY